MSWPRSWPDTPNGTRSWSSAITGASSTTSTASSTRSMTPTTWRRKCSFVSTARSIATTRSTSSRPGCSGWRRTPRSTAFASGGSIWSRWSGPRPRTATAAASSSRATIAVPTASCATSSAGTPITHAIEELPDEYRELIHLRHFAELSYGEIAELKGMPLGTVKNKLFRGRQMLKEKLADFLVD